MSEETKREAIRMPMLPLRGLSIFPGMLLTCDVERVGSVSAINAANRGAHLIFLASQRDLAVELPRESGV